VQNAPSLRVGRNIRTKAVLSMILRDMTRI
jgi:hypothetical protein